MSGSVLIATSFMSGLAIVELPDGPPQELRLPRAVRVLTGFFEPDGSVVAVIEQPVGRVRIYRASVDARPSPLGPALGGYFTFSLAGRTLLAAGCGARPVGYLLDLDTPDGWREVDAGCGASLSADAGSLAWSRDGVTLLERPVDGKGEERILDLAKVEELPAGIDRSARIDGSPAWGPDAMALAVTTEEHSAVVVAASDQEPVIGPLGRRAPASAVLLAWQPDGTELAVASSSTLEGVVRLFGVTAGASPVVAVFSSPPVGLVWSPNGDALLAASEVRWTFMSPEGDWLWSLPVLRGDAQPLAWLR
ncbi:MAG: hypothetical protein ACXWXS_02910 [Actinomycetota bacterium]